MRSRPSVSLLLGVLVLFCATEVSAGGLYVGHGRRSVDDAWSVRLNLSGGAFGAGDPWDEQFADTEYPIGGYGTAGLEFNVGHQNSLEVWGTLRGLNDEEAFLVLDDFGDVDGRGRYDYELTSWSGGLTLRHRYPTGRGGATYWGIGGGLVETDVDYVEAASTGADISLSGTETGPVALALLGFEGNLAPGLSLGLEIGYRHAWIEYDSAVIDPDDSGVFAGLRLGLVLGGP
jgi:hypothetical protein